MSKVDTACIIDDDPISVLIAKKLMEIADFCSSFLVYNNGQKAMEGLKEIIASGGSMPDLILLDLNMPVMNGWEFLESFTKALDKQKCYIFIVTSSIDASDLQKAKNHKDVIDCVVKPITSQVLLEISKKFYEQKK